MAVLDVNNSDELRPTEMLEVDEANDWQGSTDPWVTAVAAGSVTSLGPTSISSSGSDDISEAACCR